MLRQREYSKNVDQYDAVAPSLLSRVLVFPPCQRCRYIVAFYGCGWSRDTEEEECGKGSEQHGQAGPPEHQLFFVQEYLEGGTLQAMVFEAMEDEVRQQG